MNIALLILLIGVCNVLSAPTTDMTRVKRGVDRGYNVDKEIAWGTMTRRDGVITYRSVQRQINRMVYKTTKTWNDATGQYDVVKYQQSAVVYPWGSWVPCEEPCKV